MINPSFIPPPDNSHLRDLLRFRKKMTNQITKMKNRALNCLTVSNLKLDDVFTDVFGKSSCSIIQHILDHPGETFDVAPFVDRCCKHSIEEIQAAVDGAISHEQVTKLKSNKSLTALAGIDPPPDQSGKDDPKSRRISKRGSPALRKTLFLIMTVYLQHQPAGEPVYQFLDKKRTEGKPYKVYMIAADHKFLRIYYARVKEVMPTQ